MKAVGYIRVSTEGQASEGVSLEMQESRIRAWCLAHGYELGSVHTDAGLSGGKMDNRPGLQGALCDACRNKGPLVVYSLSRLARSTRDAINVVETLEKCGADLVSLSESLDTTSAAGKMIFRMMAVLAEFERDQVSERTKAALAHKKSMGERVGGIPYGYRVDGSGKSLVEDEIEQQNIAVMRQMRSEGYSLREIGRKLLELGIMPRSGGGEWRANTIGDLVRGS